MKINLLERPEIAKNDLSHKKLGNDLSWKGTSVKAGFLNLSSVEQCTCPVLIGSKKSQCLRN